ncbi:MAG: hypothetical protein H6733_00960 [Alphaproteobacteria bacterium]|nr:hypothetical protein [Alphaproteobacteria bacterium]
MPLHVTCATCHREESWDPRGSGYDRAVVVPGGSRRPAGDAAWTRVRTTLLAQADGRRPVADCPACGQLLFTRDAGPPSVAVRLDTPDGPVSVADGQVLGPTGPLSPEAALSLVDTHFAPRITDGLAGDLGRSVFFVGLLPIVIGWVFAGLFVLSFLAALYQGTPGGDTAGAPLIVR